MKNKPTIQKPKNNTNKPVNRVLLPSKNKAVTLQFISSTELQRSRCSAYQYLLP